MAISKLLRLLAVVPALLLPLAVGAAEERARFLPSLAPRLEAARYTPANEDFAWVGWIGARIDLVEKGKWSGFFNPDVETILGHRVRSFEAVQANYSLELGVRREVGGGRASGFFHHVSRHVQDRDKVQAIDWNFIGVRYESSWPRTWNRRGGFSGSLGIATLSSGVDYDLETRLSADIELFSRGRQGLFLIAAARAVGAKASVDFPRGSFSDLRSELGFRRWQDASLFSMFVAYERRNDASIAQSLVLDRALLGFRIEGRRADAPAVSLRP